MIDDSFDENAKAGTWRYLYYVSYHGDHYDLAWELLQDKWDDYAIKYVAFSKCFKYVELLESYFRESVIEINSLSKQRHCSLCATCFRYNTTSFTMGYLVEIPEVFDTQAKYDEVCDSAAT